jgi:GNAT superfamily N-acetyltransferase
MLTPVEIYRMSKIDRVAERLRKQTIRGRYWYLFILGVDPGQQGKGLGSKLISPQLRHADADGLPCYLETMEEKNLAFYHRHGFETYSHGSVKEGGPFVWTLVRKPANGDILNL